MRFLQSILFLIMLGAILIFALQNHETVLVRFLNWNLTAPISISILGVYLLGMISGWTVVAFVTRSIRQIAERPRD